VITPTKAKTSNINNKEEQHILDNTIKQQENEKQKQELQH